MTCALGIVSILWDDDYLSQFGISWKVVNHHIFDRVIYQDDLLLNYLPSLENALKCKLIVHDDENEENHRQQTCVEANRADIPQGALELAQSFRVFHKLMIKRKTKDDLLNKDLEFFKSQQKIVHNCILRKEQYYQWHTNLTAFGDLTDLIDDECAWKRLKYIEALRRLLIHGFCENRDNSDSEADDVNLSKRLHELIEEGSATSVCIDEDGEVLSCVRCKRCTLRHCTCDECRISHIITCSLLIDNEDMSNLIWPVNHCSDRGGDKDSDLEQSQRKMSSLPNIMRLPTRSLRFQTAKALFTVRDHQNVPKKETAWGDWQIPYGYSDDIDYLDHCLCERKSMHSDFDSLNNRIDREEKRATDSINSPDLPNNDKYQEIVRKAFELITRGHRMESSENCEFENNNASRTLSAIRDEKTSMTREDDGKHEGFTIASVSNINVKRFKVKKAGSNMAGDSDGVESDYEVSSASFPASNECMDSCHLSRPDRLLLKEMSRRHYAVLSKDDAVSDLALDLFGRKTMEKPQMTRKTGLTPSFSRLIRKSKLISDKNDANSGSISAVKSLSASARERLLSEVKGMDKKIRERNLLRLVQSYEDEHWTARSEDYKSRLIESMKECLCKDRTKENETNDLKITIKNDKKKVEQDNLAQLWSKQTFAAAIAKQLTDERTILEINKAFSVEKVRLPGAQKTAQTSCKMGNHLDATSNSTTAIDFSVNLGVSANVDCKCNDGKRVESDFGDSKEELFSYQMDDIDDLTDDDDVGSDEEWSDCEVPDEQHPHRHHSCDNKISRDIRHGHCDCCYCEMFGHAATESIKSGRAQIRERLRMKLKRRNVQEHSGTNTKSLDEKLTYASTNQESKKSLVVIPDAPIEEILDYINEKDIAAAQTTASKAAKRARQKLRRQIRSVISLMFSVFMFIGYNYSRRRVGTYDHGSLSDFDRVRGKKQKDSHDRKKETELQLSEIQGVEVRKEPVLEFEYWNDPKCDPEFKRMGSIKEQIGTSKVGRMRTQNKEESRKQEVVPKRASSKKEVIEADSVVEKDCESEASLHIEPAMEFLLDKELDASSTDVTVGEASTVLSELELISHFPELNCPIAELLPPKMPPLPQNLSEISLMRPADPVFRPLPTSQGLETRTCQIGINDAINIPSQYSLPPPVNSPSTDVLQRAGPLSPVPVFDAKSFQTTTNFSNFGFQKLPRYASESSSLSSLASSVSSSSSKPAFCGTPFSLPEFNVVPFKGNARTAQMPPLGIMSLPLQNDLCSNKAAHKNFVIPTLLRRNLRFPIFPLQDVIAAKVQKSSQYINAQFLVSHQNGTVSTTGNVSSAAQLNKVRTSGVLPGSSQFTAAIRAKRNEACKTFFSSSSPLADYDSETRKLAAFAKQDEIFYNQNPMIFEPGDPRIAVAIAEMKFDPHETFKPRPDSELEFLDPLELEVEHFKRVLWEGEQLTKPRVPLRELRKIDPENEPDAVFHFAPLV
ncbi:hypothetical protein DINM_021106 [Dirofilaria immitis]|nr:hypothetical protein [Dirofilaria immitis]